MTTGHCEIGSINQRQMSQATFSWCLSAHDIEGDYFCRILSLRELAFLLENTFIFSSSLLCRSSIGFESWPALSISTFLSLSLTLTLTWNGQNLIQQKKQTFHCAIRITAIFQPKLIRFFPKLVWFQAKISQISAKKFVILSPKLIRFDPCHP